MKELPTEETGLALSLNRVPFLDNLRYLMILLVLVYHACGAYASVAPHWVVHDNTSWAADLIRELFDVFMMPILFFVSGFFAPVSLKKKGSWGFLKDKVRRLLIPWAVAVFFVLPLAIYDQPINPVRPFWKFWPWYLNSFEFRLRLTQSPVGPTTQAIYWFISLLFAFFLLYLLIQPLTQWKRKGAILRSESMGSGKSALTPLLFFGMAISLGYFSLLLVFPDSSWFTLHALLEFQVTRLVPFAGSFALGVYARSRGWFSEGKSLGPLAIWGMLCGLLTLAYLWFGRPVFADTAGKANFSVGFLLEFAFLRNFLLLSFLVVFVSFSARYWNRSNALDKQLSATSYDIYLTHYWFIVAVQTALLSWVGGLVLVKGGLVFIVALGFSYVISRWVLARHSRAFVIVLLALFVICLAVRP